MILHQDFKEFVILLNKKKVEYLIVGGYAVGVHGHPRYTGDLDIWINRTEENASRILDCINEFGFSSYNLTINDLAEIGNVIQLGYPPVRIDIINQLDGVHFSECIKNRKEESFEGVEYYFIGYEDLLANKKATARPGDIDDIENLT